jgi:hypothetical protein
VSDEEIAGLEEIPEEETGSIEAISGQQEPLSASGKEGVEN